MAGLVALPFAEFARDVTGRADGEDVADALGDHEEGHDQRDARHHVGVAGLADEEGVGHVVDHLGDHAEHHRQGEGDDAFGHGALLHQGDVVFTH